jgi:hypothetical protein
MSIYDSLLADGGEPTVTEAEPVTEAVTEAEPTVGAEPVVAHDRYTELVAMAPEEPEECGESTVCAGSQSSLSMGGISVSVNDISHPSVVAIGVSATARGELPCEKVDEALESILPSGMSIGGVSPTVALKRAMQSLTKGDSDRDVKVKGRKAGAVYTILSTDMERIDREEGDGKGVSDAEVSARIEYDGTGQYTIKVSPPDHPAAALIRERHNDFCGVYSGTYDLKVWLTTKFLPSLGAVRTPNVQGGYILPKGGNAKSVALLVAVKEAFDKLRAPTGKLAIYLDGQTQGDANAIDIIADAMADERERVLGKLRKELDAVTSGEKTAGKRRLASMTSEAHDLRKTLQKMAAAFSLAGADADVDIKEIESEIAMCEMALDE